MNVANFISWLLQITNLLLLVVLTPPHSPCTLFADYAHSSVDYVNSSANYDHTYANRVNLSDDYVNTPDD
jgi:hypothetical protein